MFDTINSEVPEINKECIIWADTSDSVKLEISKLRNEVFRLQIAALSPKF